MGKNLKVFVKIIPFKEMESLKQLMEMKLKEFGEIMF